MRVRCDRVAAAGKCKQLFRLCSVVAGPAVAGGTPGHQHWGHVNTDTNQPDTSVRKLLAFKLHTVYNLLGSKLNINLFKLSIPAKSFVATY